MSAPFIRLILTSTIAPHDRECDHGKENPEPCEGALLRGYRAIGWCPIGISVRVRGAPRLARLLIRVLRLLRPRAEAAALRTDSGAAVPTADPAGQAAGTGFCGTPRLLRPPHRIRVLRLLRPRLAHSAGSVGVPSGRFSDMRQFLTLSRPR